MNRFEQLKEADELNEVRCFGCNLHTELYEDGHMFCRECLENSEAEATEALTLSERNK